MDLAEVKKLTAAGESEQLELKKTTAKLNGAAQSLCGFLNADGGTVIIGATDNGKVVGQEISDATMREVATVLAKIQPPVNVQIDRVPVTDNKEALVLTVPRSPDQKPFVFDGRPYQRVASTTSVMPQQKYDQLVLDRAPMDRRWENLQAKGYSINDLDHEEILRTVRLGIESGRLPESSGKDIADILDRLQLRVAGQISNAAMVLFGRQTQRDFPQCLIRLARFKGTDKSEFLDNRQAFGHAFHLLDEAMTFMMRHLPIAGRFEPGRLERIDEPLFPVAALREAVINALCHRNYVDVGGSVSIGIYDDRLEIWSHGTLPFGLKPEDLKREHESKPRNTVIANTFYRRGLIEQWGRGTQKIVDLCVKAGHPEPEFGEQAGSVWVKFVASEYVAPRRVTHDLTERQREILQILATKPEMALREIRQHLTSSAAERTVQRDLVHLQRVKLVVAWGRGRGATYSLRRADEE